MSEPKIRYSIQQCPLCGANGAKVSITASDPKYSGNLFCCQNTPQCDSRMICDHSFLQSALVWLLNDAVVQLGFEEVKDEQTKADQ